jgi:toxin YoeB
MSYTVIISDQAEEHIARIRISGNKPAIRKIANFLDELELHPETGTGKIELLGEDKAGFWSRRINDKHRLVYEILEEQQIVSVISAWGHYDDK